MRPRHRGRTWHWSFLCRSVHAILRIASKREEVQHENMGDPWKMGGIHQWMMWMSKHICIVNLDIHWDIAIWYVMNIVVATGCRKWAQTPKTCSWRVVQGGAPKLWAGFYTPLSIDIPTINHRIHHMPCGIIVPCGKLKNRDICWISLDGRNMKNPCISWKRWFIHVNPSIYTMWCPIVSVQLVYNSNI